MGTVTFTDGTQASGTSYCDRDDVEAFFAPTDVRKWADLENDGNTVSIAARITDACAMATAEINDYLRGGPYAIPIESPPSTVVDLARKLAGCNLYAPRGAQDVDGEGSPLDRLAAVREEVYRKLRQIRGGQLRLDLTSARGTPKIEPVELRRESDLTYNAEMA